MRRLISIAFATMVIVGFCESPADSPEKPAGTPEPASSGVRNPFWPIGYEGERETISPEVRKASASLTNRVKTVSERAADAKAAAEKAAKEKAAAAAKAAAEKAAAEKAAAQKAAREAAARAEAERRKREITDKHWEAARAALKLGGRVKLREDDALQNTSVVINGKVYSDGDYVSITHDSRRFTWRVVGLTDRNTLKLVRVRAKYLEKPGESGKKSDKGENP